MKKLLFLAALSLSSPALACGPDTDCVLGDRTYRIAMPDDHDGKTPVGAIVFAHGYRGTAAGIMRNGNLRRMVSEMGLTLIALKSKEDDWVLPNAPRHMDSDGSEEFTYVDAVIDDAATRHEIDTDRLMATGFSAGGMMVWNLACNRPDRFAGFVPISGTFWLEPPETCQRPISNVIHIHGDDDPTVPLSGRPIGPTHQGDVGKALAMYREFGGFGAPESRNEGLLSCQERENSENDLLSFCLFSGGHSFRSEFVKFGWTRLEQAGRL